MIWLTFGCGCPRHTDGAVSPKETIVAADFLGINEAVTVPRKIIQSHPAPEQIETWLRQDVAALLQVHADDDGSSHPSIPQLRADRDACVGRLREAIQKLM